MLAYILKVFLIQLIGLGIYFAFLRNQKLFGYARKFLWTIIGSSFILPLISLPIFEATQSAPIIGILPQQIPIQDTANAVTPQTSIGMHGVYWIVYGLIAITMLGRLFMAFWKLTNVKKRSKFQSPNLYFSREIEMPYSFLNGIFIPTDFQAADKLALIIAHENEHINRKHSWDKIIISTLVSLMWFNPLLRLFHKELEIVHEYQVDESVTALFSLDDYLQSLLQSTIYLKRSPISLTHSFFSSPIKNRIIMLHKKATNTFMKRLMSIILLVCVVFSAVYLQGQTITKSEKIKTKEVVSNKDSVIIENHDGSLVMKTFKENGDSVVSDIEPEQAIEFLNSRTDSNTSWSLDENNNFEMTSEKREGETHTKRVININIAGMKKLQDTIDMQDLFTRNEQGIYIGDNNIAIAETESEADTLYDKKANRKLWEANDIDQEAELSGDLSFLSWIERNLKAPKGEDFIEPVNLSIKFTVTDKGEVVNISSRSTPSGKVAFEREGIRLCKNMPMWKPALKNGKKVSSIKTFSLKFDDPSSSSSNPNLEKDAKFPGGEYALGKYLGNALRFTKDERSSIAEGTIYMELLIDANGDIKSIKPLRVPERMKTFSQKAIEAIKKMPQWEPAVKGGKKVESTYVLPISFVPETKPAQK